ncbi:hypothetical protein [Micromonospora sp. LOL_021]
MPLTNRVGEHRMFIWSTTSASSQPCGHRTAQDETLQTYAEAGVQTG